MSRMPARSFHAQVEPHGESFTLVGRVNAVTEERAAIEPKRLRSLARHKLERHMPPDQYHIPRFARASGRQLLEACAGGVRNEQGRAG